MAKVTITMNRLLIFSFLIILFACREDQALKTIKHHLSEPMKEWVVVDSINLRFEMIDKRGPTREFVIRNNEHGTTLGSSYFLGIKTLVTHTEYYFQLFESNYSDKFNMYLYPSDTLGILGEAIHFYFNDLGFHYDFQHKIVTTLMLSHHYRSISITSDGIESDTLFASIFSLIDTLNVNGKTYENLFHFQFNDLKEFWNDFTVTDIYYAQRVGLVRYKMNNGLVFDRK